MMYDLSYDGIVLKSIHRNTSKASINFDGNEAVIFGMLTFFAGTYVLYLFFELFKNDSILKKSVTQCNACQYILSKEDLEKEICPSCGENLTKINEYYKQPNKYEERNTNPQAD